jgi:hypothetical protein
MPGYIGILIVLAVGLPHLLRDRLSFFFYLTIFAYTLPLVLSVVSSHHTPTSIKLLSGLKEIMAIAYISRLLVLGRPVIKFNSLDGVLCLFLAWLMFSFLISSAGLIARIVSLKDVLMICIYYFAGRLAWGPGLDIVLKNYVKILMAVVFVSGVLSAITPDVVWVAMDVPHYFLLKFSEAKFGIFFDGGLPSNFNTYHAGELIPRNVGPILDAPGFSRFLAFFIVIVLARFYLIYVSKSIFSLHAFLLVLGFVLLQISTFGRGGMLIDAVGLLLLLSYTKGAKAIALVVFLLLIVLIYVVVSGDDANTARHVGGLLESILHLNLVGNGLGTAGQQVMTYASAAAENDDVKESFVAGLLYQCGIVGFGIFLILIYRLVKSAIQPSVIKSLDLGEKCIWFAAYSGAVGALLTSFLANSAVSFFGVAIPFFLVGYMSTKNQMYQDFGEFNDAS